MSLKKSFFTLSQALNNRELLKDKNVSSCNRGKEEKPRNSQSGLEFQWGSFTPLFCYCSLRTTIPTIDTYSSFTTCTIMLANSFVPLQQQKFSWLIPNLHTIQHSMLEERIANGNCLLQLSLHKPYTQLSPQKINKLLCCQSFYPWKGFNKNQSCWNLSFMLQ